MTNNSSFLDLALGRTESTSPTPHYSPTHPSSQQPQPPRTQQAPQPPLPGPQTQPPHLDSSATLRAPLQPTPNVWHAINHPTASTAPTDGQFHFVKSYSPPRNLPSHPEPVQPIAKRQDSAIMTKNSLSAILHHHHSNPPATNSAFSSHPDVRDPEMAPTTPPSPAPSPEALPVSARVPRVPAPQERQERREMSLMSMLTPDKDAPATRTRALSDPNSNTPSNPLPSTPRRTKSSRYTPTVSTMPPPQSPVSVSTSGSTTQQSPLASSPVVNSQETPRPVRCHYCNDDWKWDQYWTAKPQGHPSTNVAELEQNTAQVLAQWDQQVKECRMYEEWAQLHRVDPKDVNTKEPCPASKASSSKKRKADFEEPPVEAKLRRLSCDSPLNDPLTPPPDPPSGHSTTPGPSHLRQGVNNTQVPNGDRRERYDMVAVLLKDPNVRPHYEPPLHNMFSRPKR